MGRCACLHVHLALLLLGCGAVVAARQHEVHGPVCVHDTTHTRKQAHIVV
jgi:hypothetical protein